MNRNIFGQRPWSLALGAVAAIFTLTGTLTVRAQTGNTTVKAIDIEYVGAAVVAKDRILAGMTTKVGDLLSPAKVDEDIKNLYASGDFENIRVLSKPLDGGVSLKLVVQARSVLGEVRFSGNAAFDSAKLTKQTDLRVNEPIEESVIREGREAILKLYRKRGYPEASVNYEVSAPDRSGYSTITYTINEGGQAKLREVTFVGNSVFSSSELRKQMAQKTRGRFNPFGNKKARVDDSTLEADIRSIEDFYQNHGYLGAHVVNVSRVRDDDGEHVDLVFTINEGTAYTVGNVSVTGIEALSLENDILPYLKTQSGGAYSGQALKDDVALIEDQYGVKGFADARVRPKLEPAGDNAVSVVFVITEGRPFQVGQIHIEGNVKTKDVVIRRELAIKPGEPYDKNAIEASRGRLMNLNYFAAVDVMPVNTGGLVDEKDIVITVTEKPTGTINFGAGFSSIDSLVGFMEISQTNFDIGNWPSLTGGGQRFRLGVRVGTQRRDIQLSLTEPWFMGRRLALTGEVFFRDLLFLSDYYDQTTFGAAVSLRKPLGKFIYAQGGFRPQSIEISADNDASEELKSEEGTFFYNAFEADLVRDTRNDLFLPRQGNRISLGTEVGVGGDVSAATFTLSAAQHFSVPDFGFVFGNDPIITVNGRISVVSDDENIFVRQFLGGANNLRGFDYREVGQKDENGEVLGGDQSWFGTAEYTFAIVPKIRGALFYDVGEVTGGPGKLGGGVNSDWGIGVRLFMLGGAPIRLDYGIPIQADEFNDSSGRFNFTIGYQF